MEFGNERKFLHKASGYLSLQWNCKFLKLQSAIVSLLLRGDFCFIYLFKMRRLGVFIVWEERAVQKKRDERYKRVMWKTDDPGERGGNGIKKPDRGIILRKGDWHQLPSRWMRCVEFSGAKSEIKELLNGPGCFRERRTRFCEWGRRWEWPVKRGITLGKTKDHQWGKNVRVTM